MSSEKIQTRNDRKPDSIKNLLDRGYKPILDELNEKVLSTTEGRQAFFEWLGGVQLKFGDLPAKALGSDVRMLWLPRTAFYSKVIQDKEGNLEKWAYVSRGIGVVVTPILVEEGELKIMLIRQIRPAYKNGDRDMGGTIYEVPAGVPRTGEPYVDTAMRETFKETGYNVLNIVPTGEYYVGLGFTDELHMHFVASVEKASKRVYGSDKDYIYEPEFFTVPDALKMVRDGKIKDVKTTVAIQNFALRRDEILEGLGVLEVE